MNKNAYRILFLFFIAFVSLFALNTNNLLGQCTRYEAEAPNAPWDSTMAGYTSTWENTTAKGVTSSRTYSSNSWQVKWRKNNLGGGDFRVTLGYADNYNGTENQGTIWMQISTVSTVAKPPVNLGGKLNYSFSLDPSTQGVASWTSGKLSLDNNDYIYVWVYSAVNRGRTLFDYVEVCPFVCAAPTALPTIVTHASCSGESDGKIDLEVTGTGDSYTYIWSNSATTQDISGLSAGTYTVTVEDDCAASASATTSVTIYDEIQLFSSTNPVCNIEYISLFAKSEQASPSYLWSTGETTQYISKNPLATTTYTVTVTSAGCTQTNDIVVTVNPCVQSCNQNLNSNVWVTHNGLVLDFTNMIYDAGVGDSIPTVSTQTNIALCNGEGHTSIADDNGNLLFYSDGESVWRPDHSLAESGLGGQNTSSQNGVVIPDPADDTRYYIISMNDIEDVDNYGFRVTTYDTDEGGTGDVVASEKNIEYLDDKLLCEKIAAVPHQNGKDTWLVVQDQTNGDFYSYLFTAGGIINVPVISDAGTDDIYCSGTEDCMSKGYMKLSPDRTKLAVAYASTAVTGGQIAVFDFNSYTGKISDLSPAKIDSMDHPFGVEFSASGRYLYVGSRTQKNGDPSIYQYDITAADFGASRVDIGDVYYDDRGDGFDGGDWGGVGALQMGPDGKIYVAVRSGNNSDCTLPPNEGHMGRIEEPEKAGTASNLIDLIDNTSGFTFKNGEGLPVFVQLIGLIAVAANPGTSDTLCAGESVQIGGDPSATGGTSPYNYAWSPATTLSSSTAANPTATPATTTTYTLTVTDAKGCMDTDTVRINVYNSAIPDAGADIAVCEGESTTIGGSPTASGGITPYTYAWDPAAGLSSTSIANPTATPAVTTTYTLTVTDGLAGCTSTADIVVTVNSLPAAAITDNSDICTQTVDLQASGGATYLWSNGTTTDVFTDNTDPAGTYTYTVTVTDANSCTDTESIAVTTYGEFGITTNTTNVLCNGNSTGAVSLTITGGKTSYTFLWNNSATTQNATGLSIGTYTVTLTDANACTATTSTSITEPTALSISSATTASSACGANNGAVDITVSGGVPVYSYAWGNGASTEDISNLAGGTYNVIVTDANNCIISTSSIVSQPGALAASTVSTNILCNGGAEGQINLTVSGGDTPYSYSWSNSATTEDLNGLSSGIYNVTVTDASLCETIISANITQPTALTLSTTNNHVLCNGTSTGSVTLNVAGGVTNYTYLWSNSSTTQDIISLATNTYTVTVTDANACTETLSTAISEPTALTLNTSETHVLCNGTSTGLVNLTVAGGVTNYSFLWSNTATTEDINGLSIGTYTVTVTDANACTDEISATITEPVALALSTSETHVLCNNNSTGSVNLTVTGGVTNYSFLWSNTATTEDINGLSIGTYTVTVTDANACADEISATITEPTNMVLSSSETHVSCNGASTGSVNLTAAGGVNNYTYLWNNSETTQDIAGLNIGTYTVTVTDANACTETLSTSITEPTALVLGTSETHVSCNGASTGSVTLSVAGGVTNYTFAWNNSGNTQDITALSIGTYTVTVTDANNCTETISATLTEPTALSISSATTETTCGIANGAVDITVSGGILPYSYVWGSGSTTEDINNLIAGTYNVIVTDANNCNISTSSIVTQPGGLNATTVTTNLLCNGDSDGQIDVTVTGGNTPYSFAWSNSATTEDLNGLSSGIYNVTVTDNNLCAIIESASVTEPAALNLMTAVTNVLCNGNTTGKIDLTVNGGVTSYSYEWNNTATTKNITSLIAGIYTVIVTDNNKCTAATSATITQPKTLALSASVTNILCNSSNTGKIDLTVVGGVTSYTYSWSQGSSTQDIAGLIANNYRVTVTDANNCIKITSAAITQPTALVLNTSNTHISCNADNTGAIDLTAAGGVTNYTYLWSNSDATQDISSLAADAYTVTVTDANACTETISAIISEPTALTLNTSETQVSCNGTSTGSIDLTIAGGVINYTYLWSNSDATQDITGLTTGTYTVTVTDANLCTETISAIISEPTALTLNTSDTHILCNGTSTGSIDLTVAGGVTNYTYLWNNSDATQDISSLAAGTYIVTVTDANACTETLSTIITEPTALTLNSSETNILCNGTSTGAIDLTAAGGVTNYTYLWSNSDATQDISSLAAGTYTVTVTDANACTETISAIISEPTALTLSTSETNILCNADNTGAINLTVAGGIINYTYLWSNSTATQDISGLTTGTYTVTVTDANACTDMISATITEPTALTLNTSDIQVLCNGTSTGAIDLTVAGGVTNYTYLWSNSDATQDINTLAAGTYTVTVTDANACTETLSTIITEPTALTLISSETNILCNGTSTGAIDLTVAGGVTNYTYLWSNSDATQDISSLAAGTYTVTVTDANACTETLSRTLTEPAELTTSISSTATELTCTTTSITLSVSGSAIPVSYFWTGGTDNSTLDISSAGIYWVTITDSDGCTANTSIVITEDITEPTANISSPTTELTCAVTSITLNTAGSTVKGTASYVWTGGSNNNTLDISAVNTYWVTVTDSDNGCTNAASIVITEDILAPTANINSTTTELTCAVTTITLNATGSTVQGTANYKWTNGNINGTLDVYDANTYSLTITDSDNGCTADTNIIITEDVLVPTANISSSTTILTCDTTTIKLDATGSTVKGTASYLWTGGTNKSSLDISSANTYRVIVADSDNGCTSSANIVITENITPPTAKISSSDKQLSNTTSPITLDASGSIVQGTASYLWTSGSTNDTIKVSSQNTYYLTVTDSENGCTDTTSIFITERLEFDFPNILLPNAKNPANAIARVRGEGIKRVLEIKIFDRWGNMVYVETDFDPDDSTKGWNGIYRGVPQPVDTYVYYIKVLSYTNEEFFKKGTINIVR